MQIRVRRRTRDRAAGSDGATRLREAPPAPAWHALPGPDVLRALESDSHGLTRAEAERRLAEYGPNVITASPPQSVWRILVAQLRSIIVGLLVIATLLAWWKGDMLDAAAILAVLVLNVAIGFWTELRARRAMEALLRLEAPSAVVLRDGRARRVAARTLVPGDVLQLEEGQAVPADARLLTATALGIVESALTGESTTVDKHPDAVLPPETALPDRETMIYKATTVASGIARAVIVATGMATEVGRIGALVQAIPDERTLLEQRLDSLGRWVAAVAVGVGALIALLELARRTPLGLVVQTGIAVAIAAVPEGLPAVVTITMAIATRRMLRRQALVRRLPAVETLGSVSVVCTDKTGTLTAGQQTVTTVWIPKREIAVLDEPPAGGGYFVGGDGALAPSDEERLIHALTIGALANRADIHRTDAHWEGRGDPTEVALLIAARKAGLHRPLLLQQWHEAGDVPFSSSRMLMATFHRTPGGELVAFTKGAPDRVLGTCGTVLTATGNELLDAHWRHTIDEHSSELAARGLRVLALASGPVAHASHSSLRALRFAGLVGMTDPPASGVAETIATLRRAGIRTVMLTGDHRETAQTIAREVGLLAPDDEVIDGVELDHLPDGDLTARAAHLGVVSRVSPEGKLRLVAALQRRGAVVAMLGDGINDAAALKKADIGVAMGGRGTDAAKEVAGIVLQDDRFQTIAAAVEEGRVVFDNIRKFVFYLFSCNLAEILTLLGAGLVGLPLPMTPLQILWMNLLVALPALALALEPADAHVLRRHPRPREAAILSAGLVRLTIWYALVIGAVTLVALWWALREHPGAPARAVTVSFTTLALAQLFHLGNARSRESVSSLARVASNRYALGALLLGVGLQLATVLVEPLRRVLGTVPLSSREWAVAAALGILPGLMGQIWKTLRPRLRRGGPPRPHMALRATPS